MDFTDDQLLRMDLFHFDEDRPNFNDFAHENGFTYWYARSYMQILGYGSFPAFQNAINRAIGTCMTLGIDIQENFEKITRVVDGESLQDFKLSRFACYLICEGLGPPRPYSGVQPLFLNHSTIGIGFSCLWLFALKLAISSAGTHAGGVPVRFSTWGMNCCHVIPSGRRFSRMPFWMDSILASTVVLSAAFLAASSSRAFLAFSCAALSAAPGSSSSSVPPVP